MLQKTTFQFLGLFLFLLFFAFNGCLEDDLLDHPQSLSYTEFSSDVLPFLEGPEKDFFQGISLGKDDDLSLGRSIDPVLEAARYNLYTQNLHSNNTLVSSLIEKVGYPIWDFTMSNFDDPNVISIPFANYQDTTITGFLIGKGVANNSNWHFILEEKIKIDSLMNQYSLEDEFFNLGFLVASVYSFDLEIFGGISINHENWINNVKQNLTSTSDQRWISVEICVPIYA
ncbi:MAG: hypothetical protein HKN16_04315, partial [Saprospiraceae bacterium]|nr:hypothetical protein [Saprospiraceae bacterium]